ncbi:hypothetical protein M422DRAFT_172542 [Sphaerobolus stellatus SS14]|uniref:Reverse transcriptase Ty1/copia-type domain-containing protein n=1 Tax=Sphaerobolus stellatus (strain SS14) TaxID=990650 RepID=A0A0C9VSW1_SPHS4|nr:hypothetical protein M422DRAFT_172542 [Sphaerobolus stellatus SS14]
MLRDTSLPNSYWADAVEYAAHIHNVVPTRALSNSTLHETWHGNLHDVSRFRIFGCTAHVLIPESKRQKLDKKSIKCIFIGYVKDKKAYRCVDRSTGQVYESRDVVFDEGPQVPLERATIDAKLPPRDDAQVEVEVDKDLPSLEEISDPEVDDDPFSDDGNENPPDDPLPATENSCPSQTRRAPIRDDHSRYFVSSYKRSKTNTTNSQARVARTKCKEPEMYKEAMSRPDADKWKAVCTEELLLRGRRVVDCRWTFKEKRGPKGEILRYKARLVAKGFTQVKGVDYNEMFAPVVKFTSIRTLLALTTELDLEIHQMDVKTAFLNRDLKEEIYMNLPPGFRKPGVIWKLKKGLYGLKQASREWYKKLCTEFESMGFRRCNSNHAVFIKDDNGIRVVVAVYVDDLLIFSSSIEAVKKVKKDLKGKFEMTDLGEAHWILGMEITRDRPSHTLSISQKAYFAEILERFGMSDCKPAPTPMEVGVSLRKLSEAEVDSQHYQSAVGSLMYGMIGTHPDVAHSVGVLSQHCATPGEEHEKGNKRVLRYIKGTTDLGLVFIGSGNTKIEVFIDADWAQDKNNRHSLTGYVCTLAGATISWSSKKQSSTAQSSTEAEYMAATHAAKEALWLRMFMRELGFEQDSPTPLYVDNQSAITLVKNSEFHSRTKHINVRYHFIRENVEDEQIELVYIPTEDQVADALTKGLSKVKLDKFIDRMGLKRIKSEVDVQ